MHAQLDAPKANTRAAKRAEEAKQQAKAGKAAPLFPKATREEPKQVGTKALGKQLTELFELQEQSKDDEAIAKADAILADQARQRIRPVLGRLHRRLCLAGQGHQRLHQRHQVHRGRDQRQRR